MKFFFLKTTQDHNSYKIAQNFGMDVIEIDDPEKIDNKIEELKQKKYTTIFIPSELASFSEKIIKKYQYDPLLKIIITPSKPNKNDWYKCINLKIMEIIKINT